MMNKDLLASLCFLNILLFTLASGDNIFAQEKSPANKSDLIIPPFCQLPERKAQYPLKTARTLFTEAEVETAKNNISKYPEAKAVKDGIVREAEPWLSWSDSDLRKLMPDARVPRAFDLSVKGCPVHGDTIFKSGRYSWIIDPHNPFKVTCPVGHETYPANDYGAYYNSNFQKKIDRNAKYTDDGWGWIGPDGERYWFVAYYNHWMWYKINAGILNLSQAYMLTNDKRYAHKAAVMLYRLAEIYPSMDHAKQSRYGLMSAAAGTVYNGKIVNSIWETGLSRQVVIAYDMIWNSIDSDADLQKSHKKTGSEIRSFIEANLLEDIIDAYFQRKISGNFGMHQNTLLHTIIVRQNLDREKYLKLLIDEPNKSAAHAGIRYALYNSVYRDGLPYESPHYNSLWIGAISTVAELLQKGGVSLFDEPRLRMLYDGEINSVAIGKFTPAIGDSGSALGELIGAGGAYKIAYNAYNDPKYLLWLSRINKRITRTFSDFNSLFRSPSSNVLPIAASTSPVPRTSRLFAGYGLGILNNTADKSAVALTYGYHGSHYHWDFLNFELFANGQKMMPDLGYPDQMNSYVPGIYTWSNNTISHNTVVVDAGKQTQNKPGTLHNFANASFARSIDASSPAYPQASQYRRNLIMVDVNEHQSYTVDIFNVQGGKQHDYSLHGPPGEVFTKNGTWSLKQAGTLAGSHVETGTIYDNEAMRIKGYSGKFNGYQGSGFQHLFNVQRLEKGEGLLEYHHVLDKNASLRIHLLPVAKQEIYMADAYDLPVKKSNVLKYVIARRQAANNEVLKSTFASVLEPFSENPYIQSSKLIMVDEGSGTAVEVKRSGATDVILSDTTNMVKKLSGYDIETDALNAVLMFADNGELKRVFFTGGTFLRHKKQNFQAKAIKGIITAVYPDKQRITVTLDEPLVSQPTSGLIGYFSNDLRTTAHPLAEIAVKGNTVDIRTQDAILVGKFRTTQVTPNLVTTETNFPFYQLYTGATMLDTNMTKVALVKTVQQGEISISNADMAALKPNQDIWLSDLSEGDRIEIKSSFSWSKE